MDVFRQWPHRWFGFWAKDKDAPAIYPHMEDFTDPAWSHPQRDRICHFLLHAPDLYFSSHGGVCTDGVWLWWSGLADDVASRHVRLPDAFVAHIAGRDYEPPAYLETSVGALCEALDWPWGGPPFILLRQDLTKVRKFRSLDGYRAISASKGRRRSLWGRFWASVGGYMGSD